MKTPNFKRKNGTTIHRFQKKPDETISQYLKRRWQESNDDVLRAKDKLLGEE